MAYRDLSNDFAKWSVAAVRYSIGADGGGSFESFLQRIDTNKIDRIINSPTPIVRGGGFNYEFNTNLAPIWNGIVLQYKDMGRKTRILICSNFSDGDSLVQKVVNKLKSYEIFDERLNVNTLRVEGKYKSAVERVQVFPDESCVDVKFQYKGNSSGRLTSERALFEALHRTANIPIFRAVHEIGNIQLT